LELQYDFQDINAWTRAFNIKGESVQETRILQLTKKRKDDRILMLPSAESFTTIATSLFRAAILKRCTGSSSFSSSTASVDKQECPVTYTRPGSFHPVHRNTVRKFQLQCDGVAPFGATFYDKITVHLHSYIGV